MNKAEQILLSKNLSIFVAIENQSLRYGPYLLSRIFPSIPNSIPNSGIIIIPTNGLEKDYLMPAKKQMCFGREITMVFVKSDRFVDNAFLFDTTPVSNKDEIDFFSDLNLNFIRNSQCKRIIVCDIENLRGRDFINLFNTAYNCLSKEPTDIIMAPIIGYFSRSATDIETEDDYHKITKDYYSTKDKHNLSYVFTQDFKFILVNKHFQLSSLAYICSSIKDPSSQLIKIIKDDGLKKSCKTVRDLGAIRLILENRLKLNPDINTVVEVIETFKLKNNIGFNILFPDWKIKYEKLCNKIKVSKNIKEQETSIKTLVSELENNIDKLELFIQSL